MTSVSSRPATRTRTIAAATMIGLGQSGVAYGDTATVDGHDIYYEVHGDLASGEAPILLLHGGMMSIAATFSDVIPQLSDERPVIAVEQQGHGHTADRETPITLATMRADTVGVLDHLGVERAHVVGFSMGGMLGFELAVNAGDRVASLTAISASQSTAGMVPEIVRMNTDPTFTPPPEVAELLPSQEDFAQMQASYADNPSGAEAFQAVMGKLNKLITSDWGWSDAQFAAITSPVLIALGDNDFVLPTHAAEMAETIPEAWLAVLPDTTHMTIMTRTELILPMIEARIASSDAG